MDEPSVSADDKILSEARDRFEYVQGVDQDNKNEAVEDTKFVYLTGSQWPKEIKDKRSDPCLEFPQQKQFVNQVINEQRQNRPGVRIHPAGGGSKEVAQTLQGLIRGIEYDSNAEAAYDEAYKHAVVGGRGYWRIATAYDKPNSFNQKLMIQRIADPSTVWLDPDYQEPDGSDRSFAFVTERVKSEDFKDRWPDAEPLNWSDDVSAWYPGKEEVVIADYYRRVAEKVTLLLLADGTTAYEDELEGDVPEGAILDKRTTTRFKVEWYKVAGGEQILETTEWLGTTIPVVCCVGDEVLVEGKRTFQGLIRQAKDAQRMYNYRRSAEAARLALSPKAPYMAPVEAITGYENVWKNANQDSYSVLPYHAFTDDGRPLPQPSRTAPAAMEAGWAQSAQQDKNDMRSVIGMYENSLGLHGQETSGRAIMAREKQGDNSVFHFVDNLSRAIALTGRILLELIPKIYDTQRIVTIVGLDDSRQQVAVNERLPGADPAQIIVKNDLSEGEYAVVCEAGPSYATKRQEMSDAMLQLVQNYPAMMQFAGDLVVDSLDFPDVDKLVARFKAVLPPPVQQALQAEAQGQDPAIAQMSQQFQAQMQQAQQAMQGMQGQLQQTTQAAQQLQQENESLKTQLQNKGADAKAKMAGVQNDRAELQLDNKRLILETLTEWMKIQQTQMMPVPAEAQGMAPAAQAI